MRTKKELDEKFSELLNEAYELIDERVTLDYNSKEYKLSSERHSEINAMLNVLNWMNGSNVTL